MTDVVYHDGERERRARLLDANGRPTSFEALNEAARRWHEQQAWRQERVQRATAGRTRRQRWRRRAG